MSGEYGHSVSKNVGSSNEPQETKWRFSWKHLKRLRSSSNNSWRLSPQIELCRLCCQEFTVCPPDSQLGTKLVNVRDCIISDQQWSTEQQSITFPRSVVYDIICALYFPQFSAVEGVGWESCGTVQEPEEKINVEYSCGDVIVFYCYIAYYASCGCYACWSYFILEVALMSFRPQKFLHLPCPYFRL
jgi:hypothetical protein